MRRMGLPQKQIKLTNQKQNQNHTKQVGVGHTRSGSETESVAGNLSWGRIYSSTSQLVHVFLTKS
jgi:hypothetical protein